jgi:2-iminoacetate synthase
MPSFCTGCYRLGRTGGDFMDLAKPGDIKNHCDPNGISTFAEYLIDYANTDTRKLGEELIVKVINQMKGVQKERAQQLYSMVKSGKRDVYC